MQSSLLGACGPSHMLRFTLGAVKAAGGGNWAVVGR